MVDVEARAAEVRARPTLALQRQKDAPLVIKLLLRVAPPIRHEDAVDAGHRDRP